jgi:hypothetical protein
MSPTSLCRSSLINSWWSVQPHRSMSSLVRASTAVPRSGPLRFKHCWIGVLLRCGSVGSSRADDADRLGSIHYVLFPFRPVVGCPLRFFPFPPFVHAPGVRCLYTPSSPDPRRKWVTGGLILNSTLPSPKREKLSDEYRKRGGCRPPYSRRTPRLFGVP